MSHDTNRVKVAFDLAHVIHEHGGSATAAGAMDDAGWDNAAALTGRQDYTPSPATRALTIRILREKEARAARPHVAIVPDDPFDGIDEKASREADAIRARNGARTWQ